MGAMFSLETLIDKSLAELNEIAKRLYDEDGRGIRAVEEEMHRTRLLLESNAWVHPMLRDANATESIPAHLEGSMLSPLGIQAVVHERNQLYKLLTLAAEQAMRAEKALKKRATTRARVETLSAKDTILQGASRLRVAVGQVFDAQKTEMGRLAEEIEEAERRRRVQEREAEARAGELARMLKEKDLKSDEVQDLVRSLQAKVEATRREGEERMRHALEQLEKDLTTDATVKRETALRELQNRLTSEHERQVASLRASMRDELAAKDVLIAKEKQILVGEQQRHAQEIQRLHERHAEEMKLILKSELARQREELLRQAAMEKEQAIDAMLEEFRRKVIGLEDQRNIMERQFEDDKAALVRRIRDQQAELEDLRQRERELAIGTRDDDVATERLSQQMRASQGFTRKSLDGSKPLVIPRVNAKPTPFLHTKSLSDTSSSLSRTQRDEEERAAWRPTGTNLTSLRSSRTKD